MLYLVCSGSCILLIWALRGQKFPGPVACIYRYVSCTRGPAARASRIARRARVRTALQREAVRTDADGAPRKAISCLALHAWQITSDPTLARSSPRPHARRTKAQSRFSCCKRCVACASHDAEETEEWRTFHAERVKNCPRAIHKSWSQTQQLKLAKQRPYGYLMTG